MSTENADGNLVVHIINFVLIKLARWSNNLKQGYSTNTSYCPIPRRGGHLPFFVTVPMATLEARVRVEGIAAAQEAYRLPGDAAHVVRFGVFMTQGPV
jgi:hypothetical protein